MLIHFLALVSTLITGWLSSRKAAALMCATEHMVQVMGVFRGPGGALQAVAQGVQEMPDGRGADRGGPSPFRGPMEAGLPGTDQ